MVPSMASNPISFSWMIVSPGTVGGLLTSMVRASLLGDCPAPPPAPASSGPASSVEANLQPINEVAKASTNEPTPSASTLIAIALLWQSLGLKYYAFGNHGESV